jgi:large subunit ribosomal protein L18
MSKVNLRSNRNKRKLRIRKSVFGNASRPRLSVYKSNKYIYAQLIDDIKGKTLVSSKGLKDIKNASSVGEDLAAKAKAKKIKKVVFDRNGYIYHGRVKSLAEGARKGGLQF